MILIPAITNRPTMIVSAGDDCIIRINNLDGSEITILKGHLGSIWSLSYSSDLDRLYSCSEDETIKFWCLKTGECLNTLSVPKLYQGMKLTEATGFSEIAIKSLVNLGAR